MALVKHSEFIKTNAGDVTIITLHATGGGAMAETLSHAVRYRVLEFRVHLSAAGGTASEAFTATMDADQGVAYDYLLFSQDMELATDAGYLPDSEQWFEDADKIVFSYTNTTTETWGLTVIIMEEGGEHV